MAQALGIAAAAMFFTAIACQASSVSTPLPTSTLVPTRVPQGEGIAINQIYEAQLPAEERVAGRPAGGVGTYEARLKESTTPGTLRRISGKVFAGEGYTGNLLIARFSVVGHDAPQLPEDLVRRYLLGFLYPRFDQLSEEDWQWILDNGGGLNAYSYQEVRSGEEWVMEEAAPESDPDRPQVFLAHDLWVLAETNGDPIGLKFENVPVSFGETLVLPTVTLPSAKDGEPKEWVLYPAGG